MMNKAAIVLLLLVCMTSVVMGRFRPAPAICNQDSDIFQARHAMQEGTAQANRDQGWLWQQQTSVIAQVPIDGTTLTWIEVASFDFWQDNLWADDMCAYNETQAWPRVDPVTGEFVLAMQRIFVQPTKPYTRRDFSTRPPKLEESESEYTVEWYNGLYLEESGIVINTDVYEYALGPKVAAAGWYEAGTDNLVYQNTLMNYVDGYYRSYTLNTFAYVDENDPSTKYKVLASIDSLAQAPPALISQAFEWYNDAVDNPNVQPVLNPNTGIEEYVFVPSQHATRDVAQKMEGVNTNPSVVLHSHESIMKTINSFADQE